MSAHTVDRAGSASRRPRIVIGVTAVLVILGVGTAIGLSFSPMGRRLLADPAGGPPVTGTDAVLIRADAELNHVFDAPVIEVPAGTTVTWTFADTGEAGEGPVDHNVVGEDFASEVLSTGTFTHTFDAPGSYPYRCTLHVGMDGRVEVTG